MILKFITCPNCQKNLTKVNFDSISLLHCQNCGGSFFEENVINRISLSQAEKLAKEKKSDFISNQIKLCPKDKLPMKIAQEEAIPQYVTLFRCPKCQGIFAGPNDLLNFKKAQKAKLSFFKIWQIPLPSLKSVLVYGFLLAASLSFIYSYQVIKTNQSFKTQANEIVKSIKISRVNNSTVVYFITKTPVASKMIFLNKKTGQELIKIINEKPQTAHFLTIKDILPSSDILFQIIITQGKNQIKTAPLPFLPN